MTVTQQFLLDSYRAAQHGAPQPPAPGRHDWRTVRELRDHRSFEAVVHERPAHGRLRLALARLFGTGGAAH
ncbi:hypothetical protein [Streptomyces cavernicola]|uniref:Uncharacterized protein n=1 Tax=Streptomyces cavernicola TaxID=3043613 RepID=A0ABT6SF48_9ACTN|nr:hypothetical protein [Streptomyces sp. B-S-A6]MDI3406806.1 hypothetical protein [Streptomyces sp. B-S-A6]